ncbi:MAG: AAA family ATPase [Phototrophicaceae bacterium]
MQLSHLKIQNFRQISSHEFSLSDDLERINKLTLIVGPNGSGKSSILDAIWFGLHKAIGYDLLRSGFRDEPSQLVHTGQNFAQVDYDIEVTSEELERIQGWKRKLIDLKEMKYSRDHKETYGHVTWQYPPQPNSKEYGYSYANGYDWNLLQGKNYARRLQKLSAQRLPDLHLAGGVYLFEQERHIVDEPATRHSIDEETSSEPAPTRLLKKLVELGIRSSMGRMLESEDWYKQIQRGYNAICSPHEMGSVFAIAADGEYDIEFTADNGVLYGFYGLSSGERAVLNFLVQYYAKRMFNSIVLIDELEIHLHPIWQRRLLRYFMNLDDGNQLIVTTHSPTLASMVPDEQIIVLGEIDSPQATPAWQRVDEAD